MLTRSQALALAGISEHELRDLEQERLIVPNRTWRTLWLTRRYLPSQIDAIRWLISCRRIGRSVSEREQRLVHPRLSHVR